MSSSQSLKVISLLYLVVVCLFLVGFQGTSAAWEWNQLKRGNGRLLSSKHHRKSASHSPPPPPSSPMRPQPPPPPPSKGGSDEFNVLDYGAKGDGQADDTKAFVAAWADACEVEASTMVVPSGSVFLVKPISFGSLQCAPNIVFQLDGKIIAPTGSSAWGKGLLQWINFTKLRGLTIRGNGVIDGQGAAWWSGNGHMPGTRPTALRFYGSSNVTVTGITIQNSAWTHLKFDFCTGVVVSGITISSPGNSPNTDGIHLQGSQNVLIYDSDLACGDDCVSIQTGCSNINIHDITCGPGHGISIGGLGKGNTKACVSDVTVRNVVMNHTSNGVRIKTWQGGSGSVQGIMFSNIQVSEVGIPIIIDQFYCNSNKCANKTSAVAISGISYQNIKGTYTGQPVHLACSDSLPCTDLSLSTIDLLPVQKNHTHLYDPFCWEAFGELKTSIIPPINCLQTGVPPINGTHSNPATC